MTFIRSLRIKSFGRGRAKPEAKTCSKCHELKPLSEYHFNKLRKQYVARCKTCIAEYNQMRYHTEPGVKERASARAMARYEKQREEAELEFGSS